MRPLNSIIAPGLLSFLSACGGPRPSEGIASGLVASLQLVHPIVHLGSEQEATVQLVGGPGGLASVQTTITYADGQIQHVDRSAETGTVTLRWRVPGRAGPGTARVQLVAQDVCGCSNRPPTGLGRQQFRVVS